MFRRKRGNSPFGHCRLFDPVPGGVAYELPMQLSGVYWFSASLLMIVLRTIVRVRPSSRSRRTGVSPAPARR